MKGALLLAAAAVGAVGCADNDLSLSIVLMEDVRADAMCVATAGAGAVGLDHGLLDVARASLINVGYVATPVVRNNLPSRVLAGGVEYNSIQLLGVNVELQTTAGAPAPVSQSKFFVAAAAGRLDPQGSVPMPAEILSLQAANALVGSTVIAIVKPVGMRANDQVVGGPMQFPISICSGCLGQAPPCPFPVGTMPVSEGCRGPQDRPGQCCFSGGFLCGAQAPVAQ